MIEGSMMKCFAIALAVVCFYVSSPVSAETNVEFVVGDWLPSEGGKWAPETSPLKAPFGVDFDTSGTMYIVELYGGRVHRLSKDGIPEVISGDAEPGYQGDGKLIGDAQFNGMHNGVINDKNELFISDSWNHCVRKVDLETGQVETIAGDGTAGYSGDGGQAKQAKFDYLMCVALNPAGTLLHLTDLKNRRIRDLNLVTGVVSTVAGNGQRGVPKDGARATESPLVDPRAACSDAAGNLYILERGGHALRVVRPLGTIETVAGTGEKGFQDGDKRVSQLGSPKHICCDPSGNVYIADDENRAIRKYDATSGELTTILGQGRGHERVALEHPHGVQWHNDALYVVDTGHNRILRLSGF